MTQSKNLIDLPEDMLGCVLYSLPLAHDIAATALTCRTFHASAKLVQKLRPFTGKVVTLVTPECNVGHKAELNCVAAAPGGAASYQAEEQRLLSRKGILKRIAGKKTGGWSTFDREMVVFTKTDSGRA